MNRLMVVIALAAALLSGPARAIEHLRFAIEQREEVTLAYALVGVTEERLGKLAEAFADYSRGIELDANNATAHEGRARLFEARGDLALAFVNPECLECVHVTSCPANARGPGN